MENIKWVARWGASISYTAQNADYTNFRYVIFRP